MLFLIWFCSHLVPGGYFESSESGFDLRSDDGSLTAESKLGYQFDQVYKAMEKAGIHFADENVCARYCKYAPDFRF